MAIYSCLYMSISSYLRGPSTYFALLAYFKCLRGNLDIAFTKKLLKLNVGAYRVCSFLKLCGIRGIRGGIRGVRGIRFDRLLCRGIRSGSESEKLEKAGNFEDRLPRKSSPENVFEQQGESTALKYDV